MDDDAGRLVDDHEVLVLVHHLVGDRLRRAARAGGGIVDPRHHPLPGGEAVALGSRPPVHRDPPGVDEPLRARPRADLAARGEGGVEARAGLRGPGDELDPAH